MTFDSKLIWLIVHDLRNSLHVITLTLRLMDDLAAHADEEVREDFTILGQNVAQVDRMLSLLSEYARLSDSDGRSDPSPFDPRHLCDELVSLSSERPQAGAPPILLEVADDCPREVVLDPGLARSAIRNALDNALAAADGAPVRVVLGGSRDRLIVRIVNDAPPRETVGPLDLRPDRMERLIGTPMERQSLELALAALVSEQFGGSARLEVEPGRGPAVVLDWPADPGRS